MFTKISSKMATVQRHPLFEWATIAIILLSSVNIGVKSYDITPEFAFFLYVLDTLVTVYFVIEISIRLVAASSLREFFRHGWNIFDFVIVVASLIPVDEADSVLVARLLRLFRVMRLIVLVPQLRVLVSALLRAVPRVGYIALMMFVIFYMYGAVGNLLFAEIEPKLWGDIGVSMLTLFRVVTFEDWTDVMYQTMEVYPLSWIFYLSFIFFCAFVFLNMMIGVIFESLQAQHDEERDSSGEVLAALKAHTHVLEEKIDALTAEIQKRNRRE